MTVGSDDKEGTLQMQPGGRWAICRPGRMPVEITSGEIFRVEVGGELKLTRMAFAHTQSGGGEYCSVDGYVLRSGMRAAIGAPPWGEIVFEITFGMSLHRLLWAKLRGLWKQRSIDERDHWPVMDDRALEQLPEWARQTLAWLGGCCAVLALIFIFWMSWDEIVRLQRESYEDHAKAIECRSRGGTVITVLKNQGYRYNGCQIHGREVPNRCWPIGLC